MRRRTVLITLAAAAGVTAVALSIPLTGRTVPRGVHVRAVDLSGLTGPAARTALQRGLAVDAARPLELTAGTVRLRLLPQSAGLRVDVPATVAVALRGGPLDRWRGLFGRRRSVRPVARVRVDRLTAALRALAPRVDLPPREGTITFAGTTPVLLEPRAGRRLDVPAAADAIRQAYLAGESSRYVADLPVRTEPVRTTADGLRRTLESVARPAVAATIRVDVAGRSLLVDPADLVAGLTFVPAGDGGLRAEVDGTKVLASLGSRLRAVEDQPRDATFDVSSGQPVLVASRAGRTIPAPALSRALASVLAAPAPRSVSVELGPAEPRVTTEVARGLGIRTVIGSFTTNHPCCAPRVRNIHTIADLVDGYLVLPGQVFSLNGVVGRRDAARGFVLAPQILRGQFVKDVGGGISQFATTLFNAVFFSGLRDVQHQPHSYYISRYPPGRESTVSFPEPDFRFQDDSPTGVLITTSYTDTSVTVTFWGTRRYEVRSETGERTRVTKFGVEYVDRPDCTPSTGEDGFDIVVVRVFSSGGREVRREQFRTRYDPEPHFICGPPPPGQPAKQPPPP